MGREALRQYERSLEESDGVPRREAVPVVDQHDKGRRRPRGVEEVGTDPAADRVLYLGGDFLTKDPGQDEDQRPVPRRPDGEARELLHPGDGAQVVFVGDARGAGGDRRFPKRRRRILPRADSSSEFR